MKYLSDVLLDHMIKEQLQQIFCRLSRFVSDQSYDDWTTLFNSLPCSFQISLNLYLRLSSICAIRQSLYHSYLPGIGTVFPKRPNLQYLDRVVHFQKSFASSKFSRDWKRISFLMLGQFSSINPYLALIHASTIK